MKTLDVSLHQYQRRFGWMRSRLCVAVTMAVLMCNPVHAANSKEKFAFLVGINEYPSDIGRLSGCVNDVNDMRASLVKNFDFKNDKEHIHALTNGQATKKAIVEGFREFLIKKAEQNPGATVLFMYSGHGSSIPDVSRDETDKYDEALVPIDANLPSNGREHSYLLDDDLHQLYRELVRHAKNVTFIFDACHSATAVRGPRSARSRIKEALPNHALFESLRRKAAALAPPTPTVVRQVAWAKAAKSEIIPLVPKPDRPGNFVTLSGCQAHEESMDAWFNGRPQGALTYYLLQAMNEATRSTTAGEIAARVGNAVSSQYPDQNPQLEGRGAVPFLGGSNKDVVPAVEYTTVGTEIRIAKGPLTGARVGGILGILAPGAGPNAQPIARVRIKRARGYQAFAAKPKGIRAQGRVRLLTPYFGTEPVRVQLALEPKAVQAFKEQIASTQDFPLIKVVAANESPDLVVRVGTRAGLGHPVSLGKVDAQSWIRNEGSREGYYVTRGEQVIFQAFFRKTPDYADDMYLVKDVVEAYAQQRNVKSLRNTESALTKRVKVTMYQVPGQVQGENFLWNGQPFTKMTQSKGAYALGMGKAYKIEVERLPGTGNKPLYVAVVGLSSDGGILCLRNEAEIDSTNFILYPVGPNPAKKSKVRTQVAFTQPPGGTDTFKVFVTTTRTDFSNIERERARSRGPLPDPSALDSILLSTMMSRKFGVQRRTVAPPDWAAVDVHVVSKETGR